MEVQVIYEGVLEFGINPESTTSRDWKSRLFVLKYDPKTKKSTLEYYKDTKKRWQKQVAKGFVSLWPTFHLSLAHMSSYKFPLKLVTSDGKTCCLAAPDVQTMNVWYNHIQSQLSLDNLLPDKKGCREYRVQVAETDSAKVIGATGECLLILSKGHLYLASASSKKIVGVWPYDSLRRYYCAEGVFGFVAGRRSPRGEGEFKFVSSQKEDIYHRLERAILRTKRGSNGSTSSEEAKAGGVDSRPPAPLPGSQQQQQQVSPRQETPVQTSESDEDPFRNSPTFSPTLKAIMTDPPASEISPAYGRFGSNSSSTSGSQRVGGGGRRGQGSPWLHESVSVIPQPQESSKPTPEPQVPKRPALPPSSRNSQTSMAPVVASEEDTYSHTVHPVPEQFQKKNMEHNIVGRTMYNALVHQRPKNTHHGRSSRPTSDADASLYDVAFPEGRKVIAPGGDYAIARHPDVPQYAPGTSGLPPHLPPRRVASATQMQPVRRWDSTDSGAGEAQTQQQQQQQHPRPQQQSQEAKKAPLPPPPSSSPPPSFSSSSSSGAVGGETPQQQNGGSDDGMTTNPMYGSQDHLLTEMAILNMNEQMREFELDSSVPEGYSGRVVHTHSGAAGVVFLAGGAGGGGSQELEMIDDGDQEFTSNPIYGELEEQLKRRVFEEETQAKLNLSRYVDREGAATSSGASVVGEGGERHGQSRDDGAQRRDSREEVEEDRSLLSECDQGIAEIRREGVDTTTTMTQSGKEGERGVSQNRQEREASQLSTASSSSTVTDHAAATSTSTSEQSAESGGGGVQRDAKGYSKVDKNKKTSNSVEVGGGGDNSTSESQEGSLPVDIPLAAVSNRLANQSSVDSNGTPPPPLPERNYSFDESELNQPPLVNRGNGNGTQS